VIHLAGALGLTVVAEGIETEGQRQILRRLGCTHAQGFLWSRAVEAEQVLAAVAVSDAPLEALPSP
jgi:EAL domain-containing protein (putative c-di-GMP-specific phosphodiesterase class I)